MAPGTLAVDRPRAAPAARIPHLGDDRSQCPSYVRAVSICGREQRKCCERTSMREGTSDTGGGARQAATALPTPRRTPLIVALLALIASLALTGTALAAPSTTVSLTFDDGRPSQMAAA